MCDIRTSFELIFSCFLAHAFHCCLNCNDFDFTQPSGSNKPYSSISTGTEWRPSNHWKQKLINIVCTIISRFTGTNWSKEQEESLSQYKGRERAKTNKDAMKTKWFLGYCRCVGINWISDTEVSALKNKSFEFFFFQLPTNNTSRTHLQIHSSSPKNDAYVFVLFHSFLFRHYNTSTQT